MAGRLREVLDDYRYLGRAARHAGPTAALRTRPLLAVLDEPAAALDPHAEHALFTRAAAAARHGAAADGRITLLVTHRFSTVRTADLIVVLTAGRLAEQGTHPELLARGGLYAELYGMQARAYGG